MHCICGGNTAVNCYCTLRHLRLCYMLLCVCFWCLLEYICTRSHRSNQALHDFSSKCGWYNWNPVVVILKRLSFSPMLCLRRFVTSLSLHAPNVPSVYMNPAHKSFYRPIRPHHSAKPINGFTSLIMYLGGLQRAAEYQLSLHCGSCYRPTA